MRKVLFAMLLALPVGMFGATSASAAPAGGSALIEAGEAGSMIEDAQFSRRRCRLVNVRVHRPYSRVRFRTVRRCWHRGRF